MLPEELGEENKKIKISDGDEENVSGLGAPEKTKPGVIPESKTRFTPDLFLKREQLLFKKWDYKQISGKKISQSDFLARLNFGTACRSGQLFSARSATT